MHNKMDLVVGNGNATTIAVYNDKASALFWGATFTSYAPDAVKERKPLLSSAKRRQRNRLR